MTGQVIPTMTPEEQAAWWRDVGARAPYQGPHKVKVAADPRDAEIGALYRAGERMALVLDGLMAGKVNRAEVRGALDAWTQAGRTSRQRVGCDS